MATRECPKCEVVIGDTETTCPNCKVVIADFEDAMTTVDEAQQALERRKKKAQPPEPEAQPKKKTSLGKLASLGSVLRKKDA